MPFSGSAAQMAESSARPPGVTQQPDHVEPGEPGPARRTNSTMDRLTPAREWSTESVAAMAGFRADRSSAKIVPGASMTRIPPE